MTNKLEPPAFLQGPARAWWAAMVAAYNGFEEEPHAIELLTQAAVQLSRLHEARAAIAADGLIVLDRFNKPREHPAAVSERAAANLFRLLVRELAIQPADAEPRLSLIPGRYQWSN